MSLPVGAVRADRAGHATTRWMVNRLTGFLNPLTMERVKPGNRLSAAGATLQANGDSATATYHDELETASKPGVSGGSE